MSTVQRLRAALSGGSLRAQLLRGSAGSFLLKISNKGLTLVVAILLARILGPDGYGIYAFVIAVFSVVSVPVKMGLPILVMRETASAAAKQEYSTISSIWRWSTRFVLVIGGIVLLLGVAALWAGHGWLDNNRLYTFVVALPLILVTGLSQLRAASLRGLHRVVLGQFPEMIVRPLLILMGLAGVLIWMPESWLSSYRAMVIYVLATTGAFIVGAVLLRQLRPPEIPHPNKPSKEIIKRWISVIIPLALLGGIQIINANTDLVMLGLLGNDAQVGVYRVAMQGGLLVIFGTQAINQVVQPYFSSTYARGDAAQLQRLITIGACVTTFTALVAASVFWLFGSSILSTVFGTEYVGAYLPLCILAACQVFSAFMGQLSSILNMTGHERRTLHGLYVALCVNIVLNFTLIPYFGMLGAATATGVSIIVRNAVLWFVVYKQLGINASALRAINLIQNYRSRMLSYKRS